MIPTRHRAFAMRELIACFQALDRDAPVAVMVDACRYRLDFPAHWHIHESSDHLEMAGALNTLLRLYPDEPWYGVMTDHARPQTERFTHELVAEAEKGRIALAADTRERVHPIYKWQRLTGAFVINGELVRAVGWLWPPFVKHLYGDDAWETIGHGLGLVSVVKSAVVHDLLLCDGQFPADGNNERLHDGKPYGRDDMLAFERWRADEAPGLIDRLCANR